jgi:hypothetical protein
MLLRMPRPHTLLLASANPQRKKLQLPKLLPTTKPHPNTLTTLTTSHPPPANTLRPSAQSTPHRKVVPLLEAHPRSK